MEIGLRGTATLVRVLAAASAALGAAALLCCGAEAHDGEDCLYAQSRLLAPDPPSASVDVLFVIDEAEGMADAQVASTSELASFVEGMHVTDLHLAVLSPDLGGGGFPDNGCGARRDGVFVRTSDVAGCDAEYPPFLTLQEGDDPANLATDFGCLAQTGAAGCRFRQPLEAVRRGLVEGNDEGHPNEGFLRENSVLAVIFVTNGDDCSIRPDGGDLFDPHVDEWGPLDVRCALAGEGVLHPVGAYAQALLALRADAPHRLLVAAVAGLPSQTACGTGGTADELRCRLDEPGMNIVVEGERLAPSCSGPRANAVPPRRIVQLVEHVVRGGGEGFVQSICDADWTGGLSSLATTIDERQDRPLCVTRPHHPDADFVGCIFTENVAGDGPCPPGHIDRGMHRRGWRRCQACMMVAGEAELVDAGGREVPECAAIVEAGHYVEYAAHRDCPDRDAVFQFHGDTFPRPGSTVDLSCLVEWCAPPE